MSCNEWGLFRWNRHYVEAALSQPVIQFVVALEPQFAHRRPFMRTNGSESDIQRLPHTIGRQQYSAAPHARVESASMCSAHIV